MDRTYCFRRLHVRTDQRWSEKRSWVSRLHFLEDLNRWNRLGGGEFVYWEIADETFEKEEAEKAAVKKA